MRLHLFRPIAEGAYPGVLFYSEIYQVTAPIRRLAALVAVHGFLVAVPEVYHEHKPPGTVLAYDPPAPTAWAKRKAWSLSLKRVGR